MLSPRIDVQPKAAAMLLHYAPSGCLRLHFAAPEGWTFGPSLTLSPAGADDPAPTEHVIQAGGLRFLLPREQCEALPPLSLQSRRGALTALLPACGHEPARTCGVWLAPQSSWTSEDAAMPHITPDSLACIVWTLRWSSPEASHEERWLARRVAFRRDLFPEGMQQALMGAGVGDVVGLDYPAGTALPLHQEQDVLALRPDQLRAITVAQRSVPLSEGRFYPRGLIMAQPDIFPEDQRPFRLLQNSSAGVLADLNHPMAGRACRLEAEVLEVADPAGESGGQLQHWLEAIIDWGPGMQCRHQGRPTVFCPDSPLSRSDSAPDSVFYAQPRLVEHVDAQAREHLAAVYGRHLTPGARVLDLMSSVQSHLPPPESTPQGLHVTGLGLNLAELEANPRLDARLVHDCNAAPSLPFADAAFDLVLCSLSVEYLVAPLAEFAEVRRVLTPGGRFLVSFSDRWFPTKVAGCWPDLHPFERMGQVLHWLLECGGFSDLRTLSIRNWWRPADDPYYGQLSTSDPVFLVSGGLVSGGKSA